MITKQDFLTDFHGHGNAYSSYMVIDVKLDDLIAALNKLNPDMCVGSGRISETGRSIHFEICKESPDFIGDITYELHCIGYADMGAWYGEAYFVAYKDGAEFDDFKAEWRDDCPERRDYDYGPDDEVDEDGEPLSEEELDQKMDWDAFVTITDNFSGEKFETGDGAISYDQLDKWKDLVNNH